MLVLRSDWFREKVRQRMVAEVEKATGGPSEIGAFQFDWKQMRAEVDGFVLHGTEPPRRAAAGSRGRHRGRHQSRSRC